MPWSHLKGRKRKKWEVDRTLTAAYKVPICIAERY